MNIRTHILGYPRIGKNRELKRLVESYWNGKLPIEEFRVRIVELKKNHLLKQKDLDFVTIGDFSRYDHMLDVSLLFGNIPARFRDISFENREDLEFSMARGVQNSATAVQACEMRKWFDTNYHYIVPEFTVDSEFSLNLSVFEDKYENGFGDPQGERKAVICGPLTYLWLGKETGERSFSRLDLLKALMKMYRQLFSELRRLGYSWVQIDEPAAILDYLPAEWQRAYQSTYAMFHALPETERPKILFTTYFDSPLRVAKLLVKIPADGIHFDMSKVGTRNAFRRFLRSMNKIPESSVLSLGLISGRNVWKTDLRQAASMIRQVERTKRKEIWLSTSCSLLHLPVTLEGENGINPEIAKRLSFADEKIRELRDFCGFIRNGAGEDFDFSRQNEKRMKVKIPSYRKRGSFSKREKRQRKKLNLPFLPTTTIGSFPQTPEIRKARGDLRSGAIDLEHYEEEIRQYIRNVIKKQETLGLDVLVHGEPERNDMVEYFSEFLDGFLSTKNGWVQSYGSRCVKPPIIYGDISRSKPMTLKWIQYAASLSKKPVKGMLTGPVTLVKWSFPREDVPVELQYYQAALAVAEEVADLESVGLSIIQIDEAAFREAQPLAKAEWKKYEQIASRAFRICSSTASDGTQIHTHMCYSDFRNILKGVRDMDADVLTIETSRSEMELLKSFEKEKGFHYFGPGVYDIHSPAVPPVDILEERIRKALNVLGPRRLWVNPDCGLKTRDWPETEASLANMVKASRAVRRTISGYEKA